MRRGILYKVAMASFKTWKDIPSRFFGPPFAGSSVAAEISPELLGVGPAREGDILIRDEDRYLHQGSNHPPRRHSAAGRH